MIPPNLLLISISAFVSVFLLLTTLALVMRALMATFPERVTTVDPAVLAAVSAAVAAAYPGTQITKVEQER